MGMRVLIEINARAASILDLRRIDLAGDPAPGVGVGSYAAKLYTFGDTVEGPRIEMWEVLDHDRSTGVWGLVADAMKQRPANDSPAGRSKGWES